MGHSLKLVGPPGLLHYHHVEGEEHPTTGEGEGDGDPSVNLMVADFNKAEINDDEPPFRGFTENNSATFLSSGNPCLDFFFHIVPDTPPETLTHRLDLSWKHNPLITLKLICHLRGVRNTGKSDKEGFYTAALWLHKHHPKTLAYNVKHMAEFGYLKDLPEILYRLFVGPDYWDDIRSSPKRRFVWISNKRGKRYYKRESSKTRFKGTELERIRAERQSSIQKRIESEKTKVKMEQEKARKERKEKKIRMAKTAVERYVCEPDYRLLHDNVSQVFAERLVSDLQFLKYSQLKKISLASKWCPSLDSCFDRATLLCENIAKRVFPRDVYPEYEGVEEAHYAYRVRDRLRKQVLVPLRRVLELPELYMSSNQWNSLPYNRVASVAMTKYKKHFLKHDEERFKEYLGRVKCGEAKIAAGALLPHDIIKEALGDNNDSGDVAELQWRRMVEDLLEKGKLRNCLAICDVSGSMQGIPMEVSVALGLLISELSEDPWKGNVITFSADPQLHKIKGDNLKTKTEFVRNMDWGYNTDFQKVFDRILEVAVNGKLSKEQMIKKLFVFSDMEFDEACGRSYEEESNNDCWNTDYKVIERKFEENGYEVPQIVFWNLRDSMATPVTADQKGVALVSGFSKNMVSLFLDEDEQVMMGGPENVMNMAISGPEFDQLVILD